ncbi:MAG TPA: DUF3299 domain-containing protein [Candidatus Binatia bacterium]
MGRSSRPGSPHRFCARKPEKFEGSLVRIAGYIVPLEDGSHQVSEFLLVPYPTDCIHVPPPPTNQIVHVKMEKGKKVIFGSVDAYWATGQLKIERTESVFVESSFFMNGLSLEPYQGFFPGRRWK